MRHLPIFLDVRGKPALVVGGRPAAVAKVRLLLRSDAAVRVVARALCDEMEALVADGTVSLHRRAFRNRDVAGQAVVIAATGDLATEGRVARAAHAAGVPFNAVDRPDLSSFIVPAIVDRDPVVIGIATGGAAPVLARRIRSQLERMLPANLGRLAAFAEAFRGAVRATIADPTARRRFWERFFDGPVADAVLRGAERQAREGMLRLVNGRGAAGEETGSVAIVGAGPGDPELLTLRALRLMEQADVVVYDALLGPDVLDYVRRDAERIYVGKTKGRHARSQEEINRLLAAQAARGHRVVRLKGGDPFVFGRGGEEVAYLRARGVAVEIVPGITAASGCAAAAGFPLTHRDLASAAVLVTGHTRAGGHETDWAALARSRQTIAVYMGASELPSIVGCLVEHGLDPATPAALIENGTRRDQRTVVAPLTELPDLAHQHPIAGPALIVIGEVVRLSEAWTERAGTGQDSRRISA